MKRRRWKMMMPHGLIWTGSVIALLLFGAVAWIMAVILGYAALFFVGVCVDLWGNEGRGLVIWLILTCGAGLVGCVLWGTGPALLVMVGSYCLLCGVGIWQQHLELRDLRKRQDAFFTNRNGDAD